MAHWDALLADLLGAAAPSLRHLSLRLQFVLPAAVVQSLSLCEGLRSLEANWSCLAALGRMGRLSELDLDVGFPHPEEQPYMAPPSLPSGALAGLQRLTLNLKCPGNQAAAGEMLRHLCLAAPGVTDLRSSCWVDIDEECECRADLLQALSEMLQDWSRLQQVEVHAAPAAVPALQSLPELRELNLDIKCPAAEMTACRQAVLAMKQLRPQVKAKVCVYPAPRMEEFNWGG